MVTRGKIVVEGQVLSTQAKQLDGLGQEVRRAAGAAAGTIPATAFGLINAGILSGPVNALASSASALLSATGDLLTKMGTGVADTMGIFDEAEQQAKTTMAEFH